MHFRDVGLGVFVIISLLSHRCEGDFLDGILGRGNNNNGAEENNGNKSGETEENGEVSEEKGFDYLNRFGYFAPSSLQTEGSTSGAEIWEQERTREALEKFQLFAGIPKTGVLDVRTRKKMAQPRCGVRDEDAVHELRTPGYRSQTPRWPRSKEHLSYSLRRSSRQLPIRDQREAIRRAFGTWARHIPLDFGETMGNPDIQIEFGRLSHGDAWPFDGRGGVLAHATLPTGGTLHFDDDEKWKFYFRVMRINPNTSYRDLYGVALHEIGHVLGLSHSNDHQSIMAPFYQDTVDTQGRYQMPQLSSSDIRSIQNVYGARTGPYHNGRHHRIRQHNTHMNQQVADGEEDEGSWDSEYDDQQQEGSDYEDRRRPPPPERRGEGGINSERIWQENSGRNRKGLTNSDDDEAPTERQHSNGQVDSIRIRSLLTYSLALIGTCSFLLSWHLIIPC